MSPLTQPGISGSELSLHIGKKKKCKKKQLHARGGGGGGGGGGVVGGVEFSFSYTKKPVGAVISVQGEKKDPKGSRPEGTGLLLGPIREREKKPKRCNGLKLVRPSGGYNEHSGERPGKGLKEGLMKGRTQRGILRLWGGPGRGTGELPKKIPIVMPGKVYQKRWSPRITLRPKKGWKELGVNRSDRPDCKELGDIEVQGVRATEKMFRPPLVFTRIKLACAIPDMPRVRRDLDVGEEKEHLT